MRIIRTVVREHEEYGLIGLHIIGANWQEPGSGMTLAHDILEHFPGDQGTMEEEMMALGASMFVRGEDYYYNMPPFTGDWPGNFAADFPNFVNYFNDAGRSGERLKYPGIQRKLEPELENFLDNLYKRIKKDFSYEDISLPPWIKHFDDIRGWMRKGFRKARARYAPMMSRGGVPWCFFIQLEKQIDEALKRTEVGERINIAVDLARYFSEIRYPDRDYWT